MLDLDRFLRVGLLLLLTGILSGCETVEEEEAQEYDVPATITSIPWGGSASRPVHLYTLTNANGVIARITDYGATVTELHLPDRNGRLGDVVLGFDDLASYRTRSPYFGCTAGRVANRIAEGAFTLDGVAYRLATNNGPNHLHGGVRGFDKVLWDATPSVDGNGAHLSLRYVSHDGEEGYPGTLTTTVVYSLTNQDELVVDMTATTDRPTIVNLAHHTYWNLAGHEAGGVLQHELTLASAGYTPVDETLIPTGHVAAVAGTPFDFRAAKPIGQDLGTLRAESGAAHGGGYDLNYVVAGTPDAFRWVATVHDPASGRQMDIWADQPGVQLYTGNWLDDLIGKGGQVYRKYQGFCLETQNYPDAINHPGFPSSILRPGETYHHRMSHRFSAR